MTDDQPILRAEGLSKEFNPNATMIDSLREYLVGTKTNPIRAVDQVDLEVHENEVKGVIGESGCGKSTLLRTLIGLLKPTHGNLYYQGEDVSTMSGESFQEYLRDVQMIFQDPYNSFNPKMTVRSILREPLKIHDIPHDDERLTSTLQDVQLNPPEQYLDLRPGHLSGGELQRVAIARALILEPKILLADEPFSMVDVSTKAALLRLIQDLSDRLDISIVYVSHDISTVSYICGQLYVMYLGRIIEEGRLEDVLNNPKHPYAQALIQAVPTPDPDHQRERTGLEGTPGDLSDMPSGCRFKDRCPEVMDICDMDPEDRYIEGGSDHRVACHLYEVVEGEEAS